MAELAVALGVLGATVITVLVEKFRRENRDDHAAVMNVLFGIRNDVEEVRDDVKDVRGRLSDHIEWHATKEAPKKRGRPRKDAS